MLQNNGSWINRLANWAFSAYYLSWAVGLLGAGAAMAAGLPGIGSVLRNLLYYLGSVFALAFVSLFYLHRRDKTGGALLNPLLAIERDEGEYWLSPDGLREVERTFYHATGHVEVIVFGYIVTGTAKVDLTLHSPGELRGPIVRDDQLFYQVVLRERLAKGEKYTLEIETIVSDPQRTMKPFVTKSYSNFASFGSLDMIMHFVGGKAHRAFYDAHKLEGGRLQVPIVELFAAPDGSVKVHVPKIRAGYEYSVSWSWQGATEGQENEARAELIESRAETS